MKQVQIVKHPPHPKPQPIDLRTPSGKTLKY